MSVIDYAASGNTSVGGISIATGMAPSSVDNAMRKIIDDIGEGLANGYFATALPATKSAGYTVLTTDRGKLFNCTSALTLALPAAATAAAGFMFWVKANGAAVILDPNAAELIDGAATVTIASGSSAFVVCTGTAWVTAFVATSYDWAAAVVAASAKATPIDADSIGLVDSAAANVLKEVTIAQLKTVILAGTPTLSTIEGLSLVAGDTLYATAADTITRLPKGTARQVLTMNAGATAPEWVTGREVLTANRTYYVRTDGSDSNTGLINSAGGAFLTLQKAVTAIQALDRSTYDVTATIGAGTYTGGIFIIGWGPGTGNVYFTGAGATTIISTTSETCIFVSGGVKIIPAQMKLQTTTSGNCLHAYGGTISIGAGIEFGTCAGTAHAVAQLGGGIELTSAYTISGNATRHIYCDSSIIYTGATVTVTASGARAFTTFATSLSTGVIFGSGGTYSGTFTGTRYSATLNAVINTFGGGANYFPGNAAGTTATGGQYA